MFRRAIVAPLERVHEHPPKDSGGERRQRVRLDFWIVEIAADPVRDSEHSCALSPDQKVADEWNSAEHRIERVCWKDAAAKIDGAGCTVDVAIDVDADGSYSRRLAHVQPIARPSERN